MTDAMIALAEQALRDVTANGFSDEAIRPSGYGTAVSKAFCARFSELIVQECASICYKSNLEDSDAHAMNLLYEFDIDGARSMK